MERKACFISEAGNLGREQIHVQRPTAPTDHQRARVIIVRGRGLQAEIGQSALTVVLKLVINDLVSIILISFKYS